MNVTAEYTITILTNSYFIVPKGTYTTTGVNYTNNKVTLARDMIVQRYNQQQAIGGYTLAQFNQSYASGNIYSLSNYAGYNRLTSSVDQQFKDLVPYNGTDETLKKLSCTTAYGDGWRLPTISELKVLTHYFMQNNNENGGNFFKFDFDVHYVSSSMYGTDNNAIYGLVLDSYDYNVATNVTHNKDFRYVARCVYTGRDQPQYWEGYGMSFSKPGPVDGYTGK